jgi:hypothetical protein
MKKLILLFTATLAPALLSQPAAAGALSSAEINKIINSVNIVDPAVGRHPARLRDVIKEERGVETGVRSRSELLFQDNTLTRLGAETFFSFKTGTRDMTLERGSMLLHVPKNLGGAKIHTAAVTAAITGTTIMIEHLPKRHIKVIVLEGSLRLSRKGRFGDSLLLLPGKMVIMHPDAKRIPEPVDVNLAGIVSTSSLVNFPDSPALPSMPLIDAAIREQARKLANQTLVPTNLVVSSGTQLDVIDPPSTATLAQSTPTDASSSDPLPGVDVANDPAVSNNTTTAVATVTGGLVNGAADLITNTTTIAVTSTTDLLALVNTAVPTASGSVVVTAEAIAANTTVPLPVNVLPSGTSVTTGVIDIAVTEGGALDVSANVPLTTEGVQTLVTETLPTLVTDTLTSPASVISVPIDITETTASIAPIVTSPISSVLAEPTATIPTTAATATTPVLNTTSSVQQTAPVLQTASAPLQPSSALTPTTAVLAPTTSPLPTTTSTLVPTAPVLSTTTSAVAPSAPVLTTTTSTLAPTSSVLTTTTSSLAPTTSLLSTR